MRHPNKPGTHKVVTRNGMFFVAPVADENMPEAHASRKERTKLAIRVGYVNGSFPGLVEEFARFLCRRLEASRRSSPRHGRRRRR